MKTGGRRVSHTPETLAKALHIDPRAVPALLSTGALDFRPVHKNNPDGPLSFDSAQLEEVRRRLLAEIVQQVIDADETGDPKAIALAAQLALTAYKKGAAKAATEFASRDEEDRPGWGSRLAKGAALAGAAYGGLAYMRGRQAGASGFLGRLRAGNAANVADLRKAGSAVSGLLRRGAARLAAPRAFSALPGRVTGLASQKDWAKQAEAQLRSMKINRDQMARSAGTDPARRAKLADYEKAIGEQEKQVAWHRSQGHLPAAKKPRAFSADLTPARARYLLRTFGRELRRAGRA
jgi:hypothetical protein